MLDKYFEILLAILGTLCVVFLVVFIIAISMALFGGELGGC